jgi:hypothetical protein
MGRSGRVTTVFGHLRLARKNDPNSLLVAAARAPAPTRPDRRWRQTGSRCRDAREGEKRRKPPIDFDQLSDRQSRQIQRIAAVGARVGLQQQADQAAARKAMSANLHNRLDRQDGNGRVEWAFSRLFETAIATATKTMAMAVAEAKKMARHALCPRRPKGAVHQVSRPPNGHAIGAGAAPAGRAREPPETGICPASRIRHGRAAGRSQPSRR